MDTVKVTINGRELTVEKGKTVLQAAIENGIELPYYCYHPGISIDGPAVFEEDESTFIVGPGAKARLLADGSILAEVG